MINLGCAIAEIVQQAATHRPQDWGDKQQVLDLLQSVQNPLADVIVLVAQAVASGKLGLVGEAPESVRSEIADLYPNLDPRWIEALVLIVMKIIELLSRK